MMRVTYIYIYLWSSIWSSNGRFKSADDHQAVVSWSCSRVSIATFQNSKLKRKRSLHVHNKDLKNRPLDDTFLPKSNNIIACLLILPCSSNICLSVKVPFVISSLASTSWWGLLKNIGMLVIHFTLPVRFVKHFQYFLLKAMFSVSSKKKKNRSSQNVFFYLYLWYLIFLITHLFLSVLSYMYF